MIISLIAAMDKNRGIGFENGLPWKSKADSSSVIPEDMRRFKELTTGFPVIMGRKTYESIGKPLPKRVNIVISRNTNLAIGGVHVVDSLAKAIEAAERFADEVFVIGGASVYGEALPFATRMYLTEIDSTFTVDTHFPEYDFREWTNASMRVFNSDDKNMYKMRFLCMERKSSPNTQ